jgi:hypothetical protein
MTGRGGAMRRLLRSVRLSLGLLLGRRLFLFAAIDVTVVGLLVMSMLLKAEGDGGAGELYRYAFLLPSLILALPALAGMVDLERRAGCLDLALSAPDAEAYFLRRAGAVCGVIAAQGTIVMVLSWFFSDPRFPLISPLVQIVVISLFLGAVSLFWAVRLRTAGGVWLASAVTVGLMSRWFFFDPIPPRLGSVYGPLLPGAEEALAWLGSLAVLAAGTALFYLYARRRLRRPERMLS